MGRLSQKSLAKKGLKPLQFVTTKNLTQIKKKLNVTALLCLEDGRRLFTCFLIVVGSLNGMKIWPCLSLTKQPSQLPMTGCLLSLQLDQQTDFF